MTSPWAARAALVALASSAFAFVTAEAAPIGLLPLISADLDVSLRVTGLLVTVYAVTVAVTAIPLTHLTRAVPRRLLLSVLLALFVLSSAVAAAAPSYAVLVGARVVTALAQAVFWSVAAVAAAGLFRPEVRGRVTITVAAGASLAPVVGVPLTVWVGEHLGWRTAMALTGLVALVALVAVAVLFPTVDPRSTHAATGAHPDRRRFWTVALATALAVTGMFTAYTYVSPLLTEAADFAASQVSPLLLLFGLAGLGGVGLAALFVDRSSKAVITVCVAGLAVALLLLYPLAGVPVAVIGLLVLWGAAFPPLPASLGARILEVAPGSSDLANAVMTVAFNIGIGLGALLGGVILEQSGVRTTTLVAGLISLAALAVLISEPRGARSPSQGAQG